VIFVATEVLYYLGKRDWVPSQAVFDAEVKTMSVGGDRIGVQSRGADAWISI